MPLWLEQVHGTHVVTLNSGKNNEVEGDALYTSTMKKVCAIMTADCLPVLLLRSMEQKLVQHTVGGEGFAMAYCKIHLRTSKRLKVK